ncbi:DUF3012 domain-containing protein [Thalassotalea profundi]|uniref:DUF3012 domain-containing protein n=1 Tax=Thalassotalea profundi TaxID=2036687 RepID=A0ABQ3IHR3_9GAMM|nr:DUF3012 domain-containing protein [Thalassotalea profundi]GHE81617.1 hypothetical protein GCM10011501_07350 [Thalassotalea profundi]
MKKAIMTIFCCVTLIACAPEVGTKKWCEQLKEKPKGDWTATEAKDYTKHCLFK